MGVHFNRLHAICSLTINYLPNLNCYVAIDRYVTSTQYIWDSVDSELIALPLGQMFYTVQKTTLASLVTFFVCNYVRLGLGRQTAQYS